MDQIVEAFDWQRIFLGDEPPLFLLEIAFRTTVIYVYTLILLRWLGGRAIGQLSMVEFLLVIALGSAVGDAMFSADVPLLHAMLVITIVVVANKGLDALVARSAKAERVIDGVAKELVRDGVVCESFLMNADLSESELFRKLRTEGIEHLGQVAHAYLEPDGMLTVFRSRDVRPGLPIVPPWEIQPPSVVASDEITSRDSPVVCMQCGTINDSGMTVCSNCRHGTWVRARSG